MSWKLAFRESVSSASATPDDAFAWFNAIDKAETSTRPSKFRRVHHPRHEDRDRPEKDLQRRASAKNQLHEGISGAPGYFDEGSANCVYGLRALQGRQDGK